MKRIFTRNDYLPPVGSGLRVRQLNRLLQMGKKTFIKRVNFYNLSALLLTIGKEGKASPAFSRLLIFTEKNLENGANG